MAGYGKNDPQAAAARALIEPGVMKVRDGKIGKPANGNPMPVRIEQQNARMNTMNPPPPGYKKGGAVKHPDEAADKALIKKMVKKEDIKPGLKKGGKACFAEGGVAKMRKGVTPMKPVKKSKFGIVQD